MARTEGVTHSLPKARVSRLVVSLCFWALVCGYTVVFTALSLRRFDAYLMHALDMGNMEQVVWNTIHGHPFRFTNMRQHWRIEAFGTETRLSFHVEPILLPLSLVHLLYPGPEALLVLQTLVLASGALPARNLARRHLPGSRTAEIVFPLAYLLFPAMQAANLYEFHPVTLTAALLLWALDFADQARPLPFAVTAVAALACKEEIGLLVALMALWSLRRGMPARCALPLAAGAAAWSLIAVLLIIPIAERIEHNAVASSPYLTRYLDRGLTAPGRYTHVTVLDVARYWLAHPDRLVDVVLGPPKRGFLQRLLAPTGYLALLSPITLAISLPGLLLILLSLDQHMYGGLGHYSAEFVGIFIGSAIFGLAWLAALAERHGWRRDRLTTCGCLALLALSVANARVNGFGPGMDGFSWPTLTPHIKLAARMLALIPPDAAVSAQDTLNPHLSDRAEIYLFPDVQGAQYVALDVSASPDPTGPRQEQQQVEAMLRSRRWDVLFADDGYLLLRRRATSSAVAPILPPTFYSFALPAHPVIAHPLRVSAGNGLVLLGYGISRRETVNLRVPDVVLTTYWQAQRTVVRPLVMTDYLTGVQGGLKDVFADQAALAWLPITSWSPGRIVAVESMDMGVGATQPGAVQACLSVHPPGAGYFSPRAWLPLRVLHASARSGPVRLLDSGRALCVGEIPVTF
jgi:uncharacterized membrane protein